MQEQCAARTIRTIDDSYGSYLLCAPVGGERWRSSLRVFSDVFLHAFSDPDQRKPDQFPRLFVVTDNDPLSHVNTQRRLWLSETDIERVGFAIVFPVQGGILLVKQFYRFHTTFLQSAVSVAK